MLSVLLACIACILSIITSSTANDLSKYGALKIVLAYSVIKTKVLQYLIAFIIFVAIFLYNHSGFIFSVRLQ